MTSVHLTQSAQTPRPLRCWLLEKQAVDHQPHIVNLLLIKLVRISGFSSLFTAIAVFLALSGSLVAGDFATCSRFVIIIVRVW